MTQEQAIVHAKLMAMLPVRTHKSPVDITPRISTGAKYGRKRSATQAARMRSKIKEFRRLGWSSAKIAARLKVTRQTVWNYERKIDAR